MKTKLTTLIVVLAASIAQAGQPSSAAELAKNSRKPTAAEMQSKGSGIYVAPVGVCKIRIPVIKVCLYYGPK